MEKYVVVGTCNGETVYWNKDRKGWYIHQYDATVTVECVENITFKKIN